jgi:ribonucleoside-triphosphate reductase
MLGVGMGFDVKGAGKVRIRADVRVGPDVHRVADSREGWYEALRVVLNAYVGRGTLPTFDFTGVRPAGSRITTFGGEASGPEPLSRMLHSVSALLRARGGKYITSGDITDVMNMVGVCVVSGNVRRSAEIALGSPDDAEFVALKDPASLNALTARVATVRDTRGTFDAETNTLLEQEYEELQAEINVHPLVTHRWASNNTVLCGLGQRYDALARMTIENGEPGYGWPEVFRGWGRLCDPPTHADEKAEGFNPCGEQTLWDGELCCLVETFPTNHLDANGRFDLADFQRTCQFAFLYAKVVTCIPTHRPKTNAVMSRNRRVGLSMAGVFELYDKIGMSECVRAWDETYRYIRALDRDYSGWMGVPESIKVTSVKPGGTVPLLWGIEGGMKLPMSPHYFRTIRIADTSNLLPRLRAAGYKIEPAEREPNTVVAYFPVADTRHARFAGAVSLWEQAALFTALQRYWSDNMVSATLMFEPHERADVARVLDVYEGQWKAVSFLPRDDHGFPQAPYIPSEERTVLGAIEALRPLDLTHLASAHEQDEKWCSGGVCETAPRTGLTAADLDAVINPNNAE